MIESITLAVGTAVAATLVKAALYSNDFATGFPAALLAEAEAIFAPAVALKVDPSAPVEADPYADPQYQVPDDLVW